MGINAQGLGESLVLGVETSFKTMPGTPKAAKIPIINPAIKLDITRFRSDALTGSPEPRPVVDGKHKVGGQYELECSKDSLALPLYGLMGTVSSVGIAGLYEHTFVLGDSPYFFAEEGQTDITQYILWNGLRHSMGSFKFDPEGLMKATFNVLGAKQTEGLVSPVASGGNLRDDSGADPFDYTVLSLEHGGTAITYLQAMTLDIDRGAEGVMAIDGTKELIDIILKVASLKGTVKSLYRDAVLMQEASASTETSLRMLQPSGSVGHGLSIYMPTVKLQPSSPTTSGTGLVTLDFNYDAYARGTASDHAARIGGFGFTSVLITVVVNDVLNIKIDGGSTQNFTLTPGAARTPAQIVTDLGALTGATAFVENNRVVIQSATKGTASSVQVLASTAAATLGYQVTTVNGYSAKSAVIRLCNANATVTVA